MGLEAVRYTARDESGTAIPDPKNIPLPDSLLRFDIILRDIMYLSIPGHDKFLPHYLRQLLDILSITEDADIIVNFINLLFFIAPTTNCTMFDIKTEVQAEMTIFKEGMGFRQSFYPFLYVARHMQERLFCKNSMSCNIEKSMRSIIYNIALPRLSSTSHTNDLPFSEIFTEEVRNKTKGINVNWQVLSLIHI